MAAFWKFSVFVGTVGALLVAFSVHAGLDPVTQVNGHTVNAQLHFNFDSQIKESVIPGYLFLAGLLCVLYQILTTTLGLLANFFWAPRPQVNDRRR